MPDGASPWVESFAIGLVLESVLLGPREQARDGGDRTEEA
jgi:hypothetical protein